MTNSPTPLFQVLTDDIWSRGLKRARSYENTIASEIRMKLHPQNEVPGTHNPVALPKPVELREVVEAIELLYAAFRLRNVGGKCYYQDALNNRLNDIKSRLA